MQRPSNDRRLLKRFQKARRRDRMVYLRTHPLLFSLLPIVRRWEAFRFGRHVVVNSPRAFSEALSDLPLDRTAPTTTGGKASGSIGSEGTWFAETGEEHRASRRALSASLSSRGIAALRETWSPLLGEAIRQLEAGGSLDVVPLATEISGRTLAAMLNRSDLDRADCIRLANAARAVAWRGARGHLPLTFGWLRSVVGRDGSDAELVTPIRDILGASADSSSQMLAIATVNTMYAAIPRAVAWAADGEMWAAMEDDSTRETMVAELLRVVAPSPLLPRVAADSGNVGGCPVRAGDQLVLMARHAVGAHNVDPDPNDPVDPAIARLIFGTGPHTCPGAGLARAQTEDVLTAFARFRPVVIRARADARVALPAWKQLVIRARET